MIILRSVVLLFAVTGLVHDGPSQSAIPDPRDIARRVLASELEPVLPAKPVGDWLRELVQPELEMQWTGTSCPATNPNSRSGPRLPDSPVCVFVSAGRGVERWPERPRHPGPGGLVVVLSIRMGMGQPWGPSGWTPLAPQVEDLFIERDNDSLSIARLSDLPRLLQLSSAEWPKPELSVSAEEIRCDKKLPLAGERVTCETLVRNSGDAAGLAIVTAHVSTRATSDLAPPGAAQVMSFVISPHDQVNARWSVIWPGGLTPYSIAVDVELRTAHAYGGYRVPVRERNEKNNRAVVVLRPQ